MVVAITGFALFLNSASCIHGTLSYLMNVDSGFIYQLYIALLVTAGLTVFPTLLILVLLVFWFACFFVCSISMRRAFNPQPTQNHAPPQTSSNSNKRLFKHLKVIHCSLDMTKKSKECSICIDSFRRDSKIIPLPCDFRHYFHEKCITEWLRTHDVCPICRKQILYDMVKKMPSEKEILKSLKEMN